MAPRFSLSVALAATLVLGPVAGARAQSGVTIDPDSPAGREYALPLDAARSGGGGGKDRGTSQPRTTPDDEHGELFGAGIGDGRATGEKDGGTGATTTRSDTSAKREREREARAASGRPTTTERAPSTGTGTTATTAAPSSVAASSGGGGGSGTVLAIAAGTLLVGALAGLLLRARSRSTRGASR